MREQGTPRTKSPPLYNISTVYILYSTVSYIIDIKIVPIYGTCKHIKEEKKSLILPQTVQKMYKECTKNVQRMFIHQRLTKKNLPGQI